MGHPRCLCTRLGRRRPWCPHLFLLFSAVAIGPSGTYSSNSPASPLSSASLTSPLSPFSLVSGSQGSPTKPGPGEVSEPGVPRDPFATTGSPAWLLGWPKPSLSGNGWAPGTEHGWVCSGLAWGHRFGHVHGLWCPLVTSGSLQGLQLGFAAFGLLHQAALKAESCSAPAFGFRTSSCCRHSPLSLPLLGGPAALVSPSST